MLILPSKPVQSTRLRERTEHPILTPTEAPSDIRIESLSTRSRRGRSCWWRRRRSSPSRNARPRGSEHRTVDVEGEGNEGQRRDARRGVRSEARGKKIFLLFFDIADKAGGDGPMTHLIDGDDLAVVVEPVGLGAKDLHLRSSAGSAGRVWVSAAGFSFGLLLWIWLSAASAGRRQPDRSPNVARPRPRRARARYGHAPRCWVSRTRPGRGRDSFGKRSWESLTLAPRGGPMGSGFFSSAGLAASSSCGS